MSWDCQHTCKVMAFFGGMTHSFRTSITSMTCLKSLQTCTQENVLRPLLQRFFTRHETQDGGWQWSRSREQARPVVSGQTLVHPQVACWDAVRPFACSCFHQIHANRTLPLACVCCYRATFHTLSWVTTCST